ncbi:hypothetical protein [Flavobacterium sp. CS20]|uniref:HYC_CC_PP family protein n=1 Tax=Flavobacterium sp. CS20 TaxID=2775246 RepID=UPI001B3A7162|nr:hypothetical protein [Flavobacterium sp. CS20]QTY27654.1 hypothetical protein IGB25_03710 [Flavobacterium sp. CS20]
MKSIFNQILSVLMAVVVMCSTLSMTVSTHYCGNIMVDKSIIKPAKKCVLYENETQQNNGITKSNCCNDEVKIIKGQDQLKLQSTDFELPHPIFVQALVYTFFVKPIFQTNTTLSHYEYPPPLYERNFQALYQVYLI